MVQCRLLVRRLTATITNSIAGLAGHLAADPGRAVPLAALDPSWSSSTSSSRVSPGTTWRRKRALSIPPKRRELARVAVVGQQGDPAELGQGLDHQHPGRVGRPGKWPAKKASSPVRCHRPVADAGWHDLGDLVDEQERGTVGQYVGRSG